MLALFTAMMKFNKIKNKKMLQAGDIKSQKTSPQDTNAAVR